MTASHSSSVALTSIRSRRKPALLTSTSRPPKVSIAWLHHRRGLLEVGDVGAVGDRLAAHRLDLGHDLARPGPSQAPSPAPRRAEVVDDDLGALAGELERVLAAQAAAGAGDDRDAALTDAGHCFLSSGLLLR